MAKEKLIKKEALIAKIAKVAGISNAKATKAYECVLKESPSFRKQSIKTVKAKDQVAVVKSQVKIKKVEVIKEVIVEVVKEVIKEVKVVKEIPVEVIKEITLIREVEVPVEVIKEVPVEVIREIEVIKEVEVVKSFDMAMLQKMMTQVGTVEVSRTVSGETRNEKEAVIVSRRELKAGEVSKGKVVKSKSNKTSGKAKSSKAPTKAKISKSSTSKSSKGSIAKKDDLTRIEGIGPKISELLQKAGIKTFNKLAVTKIEAIKKVLSAAGPRYQMHNPGSWPKQSKLAADGKWKQLDKLQDELSGGK